MALGGAYSALGGDATSLYYNPAGLSEVRQFEIGANWSSLLAGAQYGGVASALPAPGELGGSFAAGLLGTTSPQIQSYSAEGIPGDSFSFSQFQLALGYGGFVPFWKSLRYGFALKSDLSTLGEHTAFAFRFDLGVQLVLGQEGKLKFLGGAVVKDLFSLQTGETRPALTRLALGGALLIPATAWLNFKTPVEGSLELSEGMNAPVSASVGLEAVFLNRISLRGGVDTSLAFSAGAGLTLGQFRLDYALLARGFGLTHNLTLATAFGKPGASEMKTPVPRQKLSLGLPGAKKIAFVIGASLHTLLSEDDLRRLIQKNHAPGLEVTQTLVGDPEELWAACDSEMCRELSEKLGVSGLIVMTRSGDSILIRSFDAAKATLETRALAALNPDQEDLFRERLSNLMSSVVL